MIRGEEFKQEKAIGFLHVCAKETLGIPDEKFDFISFKS